MVDVWPAELPLVANLSVDIDVLCTQLEDTPDISSCTTYSECPAEVVPFG
jgi:hypothetical protein